MMLCACARQLSTATATMTATATATVAATTPLLTATTAPRRTPAVHRQHTAARQRTPAAVVVAQRALSSQTSVEQLFDPSKRFRARDKQLAAAEKRAPIDFDWSPLADRAEPIELRATATASASDDDAAPRPATVMLLHSANEVAESYAHIARALAAAHPTVHFVLPSAAEIAMVVQDGARRTVWFDLRSLDDPWYDEDVESLHDTRTELHRLIAREHSAHNVDAERVLLAGFGFGGGAAAFAALTHAQPLAGAAVFAGHVPLAHSLAEIAGSADTLRRTPLLVAAARHDPLFRATWAQRGIEHARAAGVDVREHWLEHQTVHAWTDYYTALLSQFIVERGLSSKN